MSLSHHCPEENEKKVMTASSKLFGKENKFHTQNFVIQENGKPFLEVQSDDNSDQTMIPIHEDYIDTSFDHSENREGEIKMGLVDILCLLQKTNMNRFLLRSSCLRI